MSRRSAFTLVELLVVIAIIGVLVALLLPAVQAAREAARRTQCGNNLKQIGIGLHNYHDTLQVFPPGAIWGGDQSLWRGSILVHLLPFIEQQTLYDKFNFSSLPDNQTLPDGQLIASTRIKTYTCPSDQNSNLFNGRAIHNYCASSGPTRHSNNPSCTCPTGDTWNINYGMAPYGNATDFAGPFIRMGTAIRMSAVTDGLSNTIFFGEVRRSCSNHVDTGWVGSNNANGLTSTLVPINYDTCQPNSADYCKQPCNWSVELGFRSLHPAGAQFLFGDGAVRFLPETIDHQNYQYMGAKADGFTAQLP